jgi:peptidoglycan/xylan/chitin deacetylase (PgdA/CDA1 family)
MNLSNASKNLLKDLFQFIILRGYFIWRLPSSYSKNSVAITFDDSPNPVYTEVVLNLLKSKDIKATFFVVGKNAEKFPHIVRRIADEGHIIGNHSYFHKNITGLSFRELSEEIKMTNELIYNITGKKYLPLFRPPFGKLSIRSIVKLSLERQCIILWTKSAGDHMVTINLEEILKSLKLNNISSRDILLFHDFNPNTIIALELVIDKLKDKGFNFVTLDKVTTIKNGKV